MYIQLVSLHGLIRGENVEMGRDADTGGQVRYVIELAKTLAEFEGVEVDLFTRRIRDKRVSSDYTAEVEQVAPGCRIVVHLKPSAETEKVSGREYFRPRHPD